jgi:gamma-glutamyl-gamma-aminobutyrate hydrolase PuuD
MSGSFKIKAETKTSIVVHRQTKNKRSTELHISQYNSDDVIEGMSKPHFTLS